MEKVKVEIQDGRQQENRTKTCTRCQTEKSVSEFRPHKKCKDGLYSLCRPCANESSKRWREKNKEKSREASLRWFNANKDLAHENGRRYRAANPEKIQEKSKRWREENPEKVQEQNKRYRVENLERIKANKSRQYLENREKALEYARCYRFENHEKVLAATKRWVKNNPDAVNNNNAKRRALKTGVGSTLTLNEWANILEAFQGLCFYCNAPWEHQDHLIPLSKGGTHSKENVVPACASCNLRKSDKDALEFIESEIVGKDG